MRILLGSVLILFGCCKLLPAADPTPEDAQKLLDKLKPKGRKKANHIDLGRIKITNDDLKVLSALTKTVDLELSGPILKGKGDKQVFAPQQIDDEGVKNIAGMTELRRLSLDGTHVTDEGLKHLAGMKKLETLILSDTKVTDEGMEALTKLPKLSTLSLINTKVTDTGIGVLKRWNIELKIQK